LLKSAFTGLCMLSLMACQSDSANSYKQCDHISDRFIATYPSWNGCMNSVEYLTDFLANENISYENRAVDSSLARLPKKSKKYLPDKPKPTRSILIYGPLVDKKKRKENYLAFITKDDEVIAILPSYSHY